MTLKPAPPTGTASGIVALLVALPGTAVLWGFTVDDALISARVAEHLALGQGYRFNSAGGVTDAVTPLGWAHFLSLFGGGGAWQTLSWARASGVLAWLVAAALLGVRVHQLPRRGKAVAWLALGTSLPLAAWAVAGMETPWVTLLAVLALGRSRWSALAAGMAGAWRPELVPWAVTGSVLAAASRPVAFPQASWQQSVRRVALALTLALGPALGVALIRWHVFGSPVPLAALAKPSDFEHGLSYVAVGLLLSGPPWLLLATRSYGCLPARVRAWGYAFVMHLFSLVLAGGDWMSFFRLLVPALPSAIYVGAHLSSHASGIANLVRLMLVIVSSSPLWLFKAREARAVAAHRESMIERARAPLAMARVVATVDVGWVGAATRATIVDLAGVTDPVIANLPGGHTTKQVPSSLLVHRDVDALVFLLADDEVLATPWHTSRFYYGVDRELARSAHDLPFEVQAVLPLGGTRKAYVILRLRPEGREKSDG